MSNVNGHKNVTLAEEYLNNQIDKMAFSLATSQTFSSAKSVITKYFHEQCSLLEVMLLSRVSAT
jgi:hypothetical protein